MYYYEGSRARGMLDAMMVDASRELSMMGMHIDDVEDEDEDVRIDDVLELTRDVSHA